MAISVREVTAEDVKYAQAATDVINAAFRTEAGWTTESHLVGGDRITIDVMKENILANGQPNTFFLAFREDEVVGTMQIQPSSERQGEAAVGLIAVSPLHQSQGIGGKLVRKALEELPKRNLHVARLCVIENRPELMAWYRKLGFEETGERVPFVWPELLKEDKDVHFIFLTKTV